MKLLSFVAGRGPTYGVVKEDGVVDLGARLGANYPTLAELIARSGLDAARDIAASALADLGLEAIRYLPPIPNPEKIICVGVNYVNRNEEYRDGSDLPKYPSIFLRTPGSVVGHGESILRPRESEQLDYEGEIAIVIGKAGRRISETAAPDHIAGLTCMNEGTVRDWLRHGKFNVTQGKNFERTGAIGPWMVTADEFDGYDDLMVSTRVNGELRQNDTTRHLLFPFAYLIRYISTWTELKPGDIIATGTPSGAGARFNPPRYLKPGDVVEISSPGIGVLRNNIANEG